MGKKILIITPKFPFPATGACEQDRFQGIKDFLRYGFEIRVITKIFDHSQKSEIERVGRQLGINIFPVFYKFNKLNLARKIRNYFYRLVMPWYLDGSALEYRDCDVQTLVKKQIEEFKPDFVYFDYTFLWPLYKFAKRRGIFTITRSINFEPMHFLEESGYNFLNYFVFFPKLLSEIIISRKSDLIFSISPREEKIYKLLGAKRVINLPLRALPDCLHFNYRAREKNILDVFFAGSTYNVVHNKKALEFVLKDIAPLADKEFPGKFRFHILGGKFPEEFRRYLNNSVIYQGYIDNLDDFLMNMDIALMPSLGGCGMQQKIFEPLSRGFPAITHKRGLAGYPFAADSEILLAESAADFVSQLARLASFDARREMSIKAKEKAKSLFSREKIDNIILLNVR